MGYKLNSKVNFGKYKNMTVQECIDKYHYGWTKIIEKHIDWYDTEVLNYLSEISLSLNNNLKRDYLSRLHTKYT